MFLIETWDGGADTPVVVHVRVVHRVALFRWIEGHRTEQNVTSLIVAMVRSFLNSTPSLFGLRYLDDVRSRVLIVHWLPLEVLVVDLKKE